MDISDIRTVRKLIQGSKLALFFNHCSTESVRFSLENPIKENKTVVIEENKFISQEDLLSVTHYDFPDPPKVDASMKLSQFLTEYCSTRKKFSMESQKEEFKPVVSELFEIGYRGKLVSVPFLKLSTNEPNKCFKNNKFLKLNLFYVFEFFCSDQDGIFQFCSC